jgi:site-specific DNA-cytosine methylase
MMPVKFPVSRSVRGVPENLSSGLSIGNIYFFICIIDFFDYLCTYTLNEKFIMNVVSYFDGISCLREALKQNDIEVNNYISSEIDLDSITVSRHNHPDIVHVGNVLDINPYVLKEKLGEIDLLAGGSPCTDLSTLGKTKGFQTKCGVKIKSFDHYVELTRQGYEFYGQSYLFFEFVMSFRVLKPKYFLLENVRMSKESSDIISKELGVEPIIINSGVFSGQNRIRYYWTNIPLNELPKDKGIKLSDIVPNGKPYSTHGRKDPETGKYFYRTHSIVSGKSNCVTTTSPLVQFPDGSRRRLTPEECEQLQTLPIGYTKVNSIGKTKRIKMIGNGWTVEVIKFLLTNLKPKFEVKEIKLIPVIS